MKKCDVSPADTQLLSPPLLQHRCVYKVINVHSRQRRNNISGTICRFLHCMEDLFVHVPDLSGERQSTGVVGGFGYCTWFGGM